MASKKSSSPKKPADTKNNNNNTFLSYIKAQKKENRIFLLFYIACAVIIKFCYPYTEIFPDTGGYMNWSDVNQGMIYKFGGPRPSGYSNFISFMKGISSTTMAIFISQYLLHCAASYFLYTTTTYIFDIKNQKLRYIFLACTLLYIPGIAATNMVMSDSLFTTLSLIIVTLSMWLSYKPNLLLLASITVFIFWAVTIRYIGLIYPAICIPILLISMKHKMQAVAYSGLLLILLWSYTQYIANGTEREMGVATFSGFGNWQTANNALHVVPHLDKSQPLVSDLEEPMEIAMDSIIRATYPNNSDLYADKNSVNFNHIWIGKSALKQTMQYYQIVNGTQYYPSWNQVSVHFRSYGNKMIREHMGKFFRYYLWNNATRAIHPDEEFFRMGTDTAIAKKSATPWFELSPNNPMLPEYDIMRPVLRNASVAFTIYWIVFALCFIYTIMLFVQKKLTIKENKARAIIIIIWFIIAYTAAYIYAAPINLRFLLPLRPFIFALTFILFHIHTQLKGNKQETLT